MIYTPTPYETALWRWVDSVVGDRVDVIRFSNQAEPVAGDLTVTIQVTQTRRISTPEVGLVIDAAGMPVHTVHEHRTGTVSVNAFGPGHRDVIEAIERSMWYPPTLQKNTSNGIEIQDSIGDAQDLTALVSTDYIGRSNQDYLFAFNTTWAGEDRADVINAANISGDLDGVIVEFDAVRQTIRVDIIAGHTITVATQIITSTIADIVAGHSAGVIAGIATGTSADINATHAVDVATSMVRGAKVDISQGSKVTASAAMARRMFAAISAGSSVGVVDRVTKTQRVTASIVAGHSVTASGGILAPTSYDDIEALAPDLFAQFRHNIYASEQVLFRDAECLSPVTEIGNHTIGGVKDCFTGEIVLTQPDAGKRPMWMGPLIGARFGGVDDFMASPSVISLGFPHTIAARGANTNTSTNRQTILAFGNSKFFRESNALSGSINYTFPRDALYPNDLAVRTLIKEDIEQAPNATASIEWDGNRTEQTQTGETELFDSTGFFIVGSHSNPSPFRVAAMDCQWVAGFSGLLTRPEKDVLNEVTQ